MITAFAFVLLGQATQPLQVTPNIECGEVIAPKQDRPEIASAWKLYITGPYSQVAIYYAKDPGVVTGLRCQQVGDTNTTRWLERVSWEVPRLASRGATEWMIPWTKTSVCTLWAARETYLDIWACGCLLTTSRCRCCKTAK